MTKRLSLNQKEQLVKSFQEGKTIEALSKEFCCTTVTIVRYLKMNLGERKYKELTIYIYISIQYSRYIDL